jgi:uncharacterized membrane protein
MRMHFLKHFLEPFDKLRVSGGGIGKKLPGRLTLNAVGKHFMLQISQFLATFCCTVFAGAAVYINLVEHPARMGCDTKLAATVWAPSYKLATMMQASLAIVSVIAGVVAWLLGGESMWLVGAVLIGLVVPFTFIFIMPTNNRLLEPGRDLASVETRGLLEKWGRLHAVRSALSLVASAIFLGLLVGA